MKKKTKYFTGIGSRETPDYALLTLKRLTQFLVSKKYRLRSGHAEGADRVCEAGAQGYADIYLPWSDFGIKPYKKDKGMVVRGKSIIPNMKKFPKHLKVIKLICKKMGKYFDSLPSGMQKLLFRNVFQVLGHNPKRAIKSKIVICYHENSGGTLYAVKIARKYKIPVLNVRDMDFIEAKKRLTSLLKGK